MNKCSICQDTGIVFLWCCSGNQCGCMGIPVAAKNCKCGQPKMRVGLGIWSPIEFVISIPKESNPFKGDWEKSLEQRPKGASHE